MTLGTIVMDAVRERERLKADGCSGPALEERFEQIVRDAWPKGRAWIYICSACEDSGWETLHCPGDDTCGPSTFRPAANMPCPNRPRKPHAPHSYVRVCFCDKGREMRATSSAPDFSTATKSKPKRSFGRFGSE